VKTEGQCVTWARGNRYGFVRRRAGGPDVFVHRNELPAGFTELPVGAWIEFEIRPEEKTGRPAAADVKMLGGTRAASEIGARP